MSTAAYIFLLLGRADASALAGARTHCRLLLCRPREHDRRKSPLSLIDFPHLARALQCSGAKMRPASFATAKALSKGVGFSCLHAGGPRRGPWASGRRASACGPPSSSRHTLASLGWASRWWHPLGPPLALARRVDGGAELLCRLSWHCWLMLHAWPPGCH